MLEISGSPLRLKEMFKMPEDKWLGGWLISVYSPRAPWDHEDMRIILGELRGEHIVGKVDRVNTDSWSEFLVTFPGEIPGEIKKHSPVWFLPCRS